MQIYQKMYLLLFNAVTDALSSMEQQNFGQAAQLLKNAQADCEELFLDAEDE